MQPVGGPLEYAAMPFVEDDLHDEGGFAKSHPVPCPNCGTPLRMEGLLDLLKVQCAPCGKNPILFVAGSESGGHASDQVGQLLCDQGVITEEQFHTAYSFKKQEGGNLVELLLSLNFVHESKLVAYVQKTFPFQWMYVSIKYLRDQGWVTEEQLATAREAQRRQKGPLAQVLVEQETVTEDQTLDALGAQLGMEVVHLDEVEVPPSVIAMVSGTLAKVYKVVPVRFGDAVLTVAVSDPFRIGALDDLRFMLMYEVRAALTTDAALRRALRKYYAGKTDVLGKILSAKEPGDLFKEVPHGKGVTKALARYFDMESVDLEKTEVPPEVVAKVPSEIAFEHRVVPVSFVGNVLTLAMGAPPDFRTAEKLRSALKCDIKWVFAPEAARDAAIKKYYPGTPPPSMHDFLGLLDACAGSIAATKDVAERLAASPFSKKLVDTMLLQAAIEGASHVHVEPTGQGLTVRLKVDGILTTMSTWNDVVKAFFEGYEAPASTRLLSHAISARVKSMAALDLGGLAQAQNGRLEASIGERSYGVRVTCLPSIYGETLVLKLIPPLAPRPSIAGLNIEAKQAGDLRAVLKRANGLLVVAGPPSSGKSTLLYTLLAEANRADLKVVTVEHAVEHRIEGVIQVEVGEGEPERERDLLLSISRQDANIVMIETLSRLYALEAAIDMAVGGAQVLSAVNARGALTALAYLMDLGTERKALLRTLKAVAGCRLARQLCMECRTSEAPTAEEAQALEALWPGTKAEKLYRPKGCPACRERGYRGRMSLFEVLVISDEVREALMHGATPPAVIEIARQQGFRPFQQVAAAALIAGHTSLDEAQRVLSDL